MESIDELETQSYGQPHEITRIVDIQSTMKKSQNQKKLVKLTIYSDENWIQGIDFVYQSEGYDELVQTYQGDKDIKKEEIIFENDEYIHKIAGKLDNINGLSYLSILTTKGKKYKNSGKQGDTFRYYARYGYYIDFLTLSSHQKSVVDYLVLTQRKHRKYIPYTYILMPFEDQDLLYEEVASKQQINKYLKKIPGQYLYRSHIIGVSSTDNNLLVFDEYFDILQKHKQIYQIQQILIYYTEQEILGLQTLFKCQQQTLERQFKCQTDEYQTTQVILDENEYIYKVEGTQVLTAITSMIIYTNKKQISVGNSKGNYWTLERNSDYEIQCFGGSYTVDKLCNLYVYYKPLVQQNSHRNVPIYRSELIGEQQIVNTNQYFDDYEHIVEKIIQYDNNTIRISKLNIFLNEERIFGIDTDFISGTGQQYTSGAHVGSVLQELPFLKSTIKIDEFEQINRITGSYDEYSLTSLNIYTTNNNKYTYGKLSGKEFQTPESIILKAFGGSTLDYLCNLWLYYTETEDNNNVQQSSLRKSSLIETYDEYIILDDPQDYKQQLPKNPLTSRYEQNEYPKLGPFGGYIDGCLDFWDDAYESINLKSPYPIGVKVKLTKIDITYNKKYILSIKFHYSIGDSIKIEGLEHGNTIKQSNNLLQTITNILEDKSDTFTIHDTDSIKSIILKYDQEQQCLNYFRVSTTLNKSKTWPNYHNHGHKFKFYFNNHNHNVKFQGFCGGLFGNQLKCLTYLYYIGEPKLFKPKNI